MVDSGLTHKQIAETITRETGYPVSRSSISAALHRAGQTSPAKKYAEELPWVVRQEHQTHYAARMLRVLGRRRAGLVNSAETDQRLDSWLETLAEAGAVVTYVPDTEEGFFYVEGKPDRAGVPVKASVF
jgi:hypothetical protein